MKLLICGSRTMKSQQDLERMCEVLDPVKDQIEEVISGCAQGADQAGEEWALTHEIPVKRFPWKKHGKKAGILRNQDMAQYCHEALVLWDGNSPGTKHMIEELKRNKKPFMVLKIQGETNG